MARPVVAIERLLPLDSDAPVILSGRGVTDRFKQTFALSDLDGLLEHSVSLYTHEWTPGLLNHHDVSLLKVVERDHEDWTGKVGKENETLSIAILKGGFNRGYSLLLNGLQARLPSVASVCEQVEAATRGRCNANLYLTPRGAQGFEAHFDWFDGLVLQLDGSKDWRLWQPLVSHPRMDMKTKPFRADLAALPAPQTVRMRQGDALYIPRGWVHDARVPVDGSGAPQSLHLTLGLIGREQLTFEALLHEAVRLRSVPSANGVRASGVVSPASRRVGDARPVRAAALHAKVMHAAIRAAAAMAEAAPIRRSVPLPSVAGTGQTATSSGAGAASDSPDASLAQCDVEADAADLVLSAAETVAINASLVAALPSLDSVLAQADDSELARLACEWSAKGGASVAATPPANDQPQRDDPYSLGARECSSLLTEAAARAGDGPAVSSGATMSGASPSWEDVRSTALADLTAVVHGVVKREAVQIARVRTGRRQYLDWHAARKPGPTGEAG